VRTGIIAALLVCLGLLAYGEPEESSFEIWSIGKAGNGFNDFGLAPNQYANWSGDPTYFVNISDTKDWPYVHPGPDDPWAGATAHTFTVVFNIAEMGPAGDCRLKFYIADAHESGPPKLEISINGAKHVCDVNKGNGAAINGDPAAGAKNMAAVNFPSSELRAGENQIAITSVAGSWLVYDYVALAAPQGMKLGQTKAATVMAPPATFPALMRKGDENGQLVKIDIFYGNEKPGPFSLQIGEGAALPVELKPGRQLIDAMAKPVTAEATVPVKLLAGNEVLATASVTLRPVRPITIYLLPHSHVDIGYTHIQTEIEDRQIQHLETAMKEIEETAGYPEGARFKWNTEVTWPVDCYFRKCNAAQRGSLMKAARKGDIGIDAMYGNQLTALSRPEELARLIDFALDLRKEGITFDSAMISDVPGYTWGIVPVYAQTGVRYFSVGPNRGDRIGHVLTAWGDRPFYWASPSGKERILCWVADEGYSWFHGKPLREDSRILQYTAELEEKRFPYDMTCLRYTVSGDNGPPDVELSEFVRDWNERYVSPRLYIGTTHECFSAFEAKYGSVLPVFSGDITPYWEDGAASSAAETAMAREAAETLTQAEILWTTRRGAAAFPHDRMWEAWRNIILYNEHTWGAYCSISKPDLPFVKAQWRIKQGFAVAGLQQARQLLSEAMAGDDGTRGAVRVLNTSSWARTELVTLSKEIASAGDCVLDEDEKPALSQRLSTGELAFLAEDVPGLGSRVYRVTQGQARQDGGASVKDAVLSNGRVTAVIDPASGGIASLVSHETGQELAVQGTPLNAYFYVPGTDPAGAQPAAPATITIKESGPLVASLVVTSDAPGCRGLTREYRVVSGCNRVDIINTIDKLPIREKEGVHFAFPFQVPEGVVRAETPWAVVRPEADQLPGSCKNYLTVQRWVDVSNQDSGVTWATVDAPLVEVGGIFAEVPWMTRLEPSQTLYSYVMNNYWHTNYKADQEGPTVFRYALMPHRLYNGAAAARFGTECSQPLCVVAEAPGAKGAPSFLETGTPGVVVTTIKAANDGKGLVARLYNVSGQPETVALTRGGKPVKARFSDMAESDGGAAPKTFVMGAYEIVTVRMKK